MRGTCPNCGFRSAPEPYDADEALSDFVKWARERELTDNTIRTFGSALVRLRTFLGRPLTEAAEGDLVRWTRFAGRGRARQTERTYVTAVRRFYAWTEATGRTPGNPAVHLRWRTQSEINREERARREAEMDEVEKFFRQHPEALDPRRATFANDLRLLSRQTATKRAEAAQ